MTSSEDRQEHLLEAEDGRYFAIDKAPFGDGLAAIATEERLRGMIVGFSLPSAPALLLHLAYEAFTAYRGIDVTGFFDQRRQGRWPDDQKPLFDFFERFISHVVFSFTALESFANEVIPSGYSYTTIDKKTGQSVTYDRNEIERYVSLEEKLSTLLPNALGIKSPKGVHTWRDFKKLKKVRDRVIHLKTADQTRTGPDVMTIWGYILRNAKEPFCDNTHKLMGHFTPAVANRRWYKKYPYMG